MQKKTAHKTAVKKSNNYLEINYLVNSETVTLICRRYNIK